MKTGRDRSPPKLAKNLIKIFARSGNRQYLLGDLEESYCRVLKDRGVLFSYFWYWYQAVIPFPDYVITQLSWSAAMFKNYLKIAFRNIRKHKAYTFINISGLAIGITCCIQISLMILDDVNFNKFHENIENIYITIQKGRFFTDVPYPLADGLKQEFPEVAAVSRYKNFGQTAFKYKDKLFFENSVYLVDPSFLQIFSFELVSGDKNTALSDPHSIVISRDIAEKYFAKENPIGKVFTVNNENIFKVTGVFKNVPYNSSLQFDVLLPIAFYLEGLYEKRKYSTFWGWNITDTLVLLHDNTQEAAVNNRLKDYVKGKVIETYGTAATENYKHEFSIEAFKDLRFSRTYGGGGRARGLSILSAISFFILLIACLNFMNLSTARSAGRAKEIGLRKVVGANRRNIIRQFLTESLLLSFVALFLAAGITVIVLPHFNNLFNRNMPVSLIFNGYILPLLAGITIFTGLAGGSYPAFYLSSFKPVNTLQGKLRSGMRRPIVRRILVIFQFVLTISLIIGTAVIYKQIDFIKNKDLGYDKEHVIYLPLTEEILKDYTMLKNKLREYPEIVSITGTVHPPHRIGSNSTYAKWTGQTVDNETRIWAGRIDYDYIETLKIKLIEGRDFSRELTSNKGTDFIVNQQMVKLMGVESPMGMKLQFRGRGGVIIGVVEDYHFLRLRNQIPPLALFLNPEDIRYLVVRISPNDIPATIKFIEDSWKEIIPSYPFAYRFLDTQLEMIYGNEERAKNIMRSFAIIAIFIACMGLFGLNSYMTEQRTKEIGIRKVLGAPVSKLINLLLKEFVKLVLVSNLVAWPLSYLLMNKWLEDYAYRTNIDIMTLLLPSLIALVLAILTVSFNAGKAARANPVDSLKYE